MLGSPSNRKGNTQPTKAIQPLLPLRPLSTNIEQSITKLFNLKEGLAYTGRLDCLPQTLRVQSAIIHQDMVMREREEERLTSTAENVIIIRHEMGMCSPFYVLEEILQETGIR